MCDWLNLIYCCIKDEMPVTAKLGFVWVQIVGRWKQEQFENEKAQNKIALKGKNDGY